QTEAKSEMDGLSGVWRFVAIETLGRPWDSKDVARLDYRWQIEENGIICLPRNADKVGMEYRLNPGKTPKTIDVVETKGEVVERFGPRTSLGIYRRNGDTLEICLSIAGKRPTKFATARDTPFILYKLQ